MQTSRIYDTYARFYDATFGVPMRARIADAVRQIEARPGQRVLDLGVGTGISLDHYPAGPHVVGCDLSAGMLRQAQRKARPSTSLVRADAMRLPFEDDAFDHVFMSHVASVVHDPWHLMREVVRVSRSGATLVIVNRFRSPNRVLGELEERLNPVFLRLGWRAGLPMRELMEAAGVRSWIRHRVRSLDLWETVISTIEKPKAARIAPEPVAPAQL